MVAHVSEIGFNSFAIEKTFKRYCLSGVYKMVIITPQIQLRAYQAWAVARLSLIKLYPWKVSVKELGQFN